MISVSRSKLDCISHPIDDRFVVIRNDYMRICEFLNGGTGKRIAVSSVSGKSKSFKIDGAFSIEILRCAASLLDYFEFRSAQCSWVSISSKQLAGEMLDLFPAKTVAAALQWMVLNKLLDRDTDSNKLNKTYRYRFNVERIQLLIDSIEESLLQNSIPISNDDCKTTERSPTSESGYVYLIRAVGTNRWKIGVSRSLRDRKCALRGQSPFPLDVEHTIKSTDYLALESQLHTKFDSKRVHREWFELDANDVNYIKSIGGAA